MAGGFEFDHFTRSNAYISLGYLGRAGYGGGMIADLLEAVSLVTQRPGVGVAAELSVDSGGGVSWFIRVVGSGASGSGGAGLTFRAALVSALRDVLPAGDWIDLWERDAEVVDLDCFRRVQRVARGPVLLQLDRLRTAGGGSAFYAGCHLTGGPAVETTAADIVDAVAAMICEADGRLLRAA